MVQPRFGLYACGSNYAGQLYISEDDRRRCPMIDDASSTSQPLWTCQQIQIPSLIMTAQANLRILYTDVCTLVGMSVFCSLQFIISFL